MEFIVFLLVSAIPPLILLGYISWQDSLKREPLSLVVLAFVSGFAVVLFALVIGEILIKPIALQILMTTMNLIAFLAFASFIGAGLLEEFGKLLVFGLLIWKRDAFNEYIDGIVYLVAISMGFAAVENLYYGLFVTGITSPVLILRGFTAVPMHAVASGIMGYFVGKGKMGNNKGQIFLGFLIAVIIHGFYDFWLMVQPLLFFLPPDVAYFGTITGLVIMVLGGFIALVYLTRRARQLDSGGS